MASTYPTQTQPRRLGDLLIWEPHSGYCRKSVTIKNAGGSAVDILDPVGYPLKLSGSIYELAYAGDEASVVALLLYQNEISLAAGATTLFNVGIIVRGPVILNYSQGLPTVDAAGSAFTISTIVTALAALSPPMIAYAEPTIQATQSS